MSDSNVPGMIAATALTGPELFYVVQAGNDRKATATQIQTFIGSGLAIGTTAITGGTTGRILYDNAGVVGEALLTYSAAQLQLGAADAASPVAQTLQVQNVVAGTSNINGVNATVIGSLSTGSGTSGDIIFKTGGTGAGAAVQNTAATALTLKGATQQVLVATSLAAGTAASGLNTGDISVSRTTATGALFLGSDGATYLFRSNTATAQFTVNNTTAWNVPAVSVLQIGPVDAGTATAQTLQVQNIAPGISNTSGANWTIQGSLSTGSGTSGDIIFATGGTGAGATSQNTATTALTIKGATQQVIMATTPRISVAPTANSSASTTITSGADSSTNCGHRIQLNLNGTTYWIPCSSVAF